MSKYIIKNCPAYLGADCTGFGNGGCKDCTDCVMKQIVELYKNIQFLSTKNRRDLYAVKVFANDILKLLDIEEVE